MLCPKCNKKTRGSGKKVFMKTDVENECYVCPECGEVIKWGGEDE